MIYDITRFLAGLILKIFFKFRVHGEREIETGVPVILCANHRSLLDPFIVAVTFKNKMQYMGKKELFSNKIVAAYISKLGVFPVDREANPLPALKYALKLLRNNQILGIFPEGTRMDHYDEYAVKSGTGYLAVKSKSMIIPVKISSEYKLFRTIDVYVGEGYYYSEYFDKKLDSSVYEEISRDIMRKVISLSAD